MLTNVHVGSPSARESTQSALYVSSHGASSYGEIDISSLAVTMTVANSDRTIQRWMAGLSPPPYPSH